VKTSAAIASLLETFAGGSRLIYVDCGARKGKLPPPLRRVSCVEYVGVEADPAECARLNAAPKPRHRYVQAVLGRAAEARTFRVTRNPASASLLEPNHEFLSQFLELRDSFHVERVLAVQTMPLDACLARHDVPRADFLELDVQGSELDVLIGAERTLRATIGVQVEVEFVPMYVDQPLFADVDAFLRGQGFQLFDLSRYHVRRAGLDTATPTRGQLLWGHALYLREDRGLDQSMAARLAVVAGLLDVPDLAGVLLTRLAASAGSREKRRAAERARDVLTTPRNEGVATGASHDRAVWRD
jgi:FkbM family methyltransferase